MSDGGTSSPNPTPASGSPSGPVGETRAYRPDERIDRTGIPGPC